MKKCDKCNNSFSDKVFPIHIQRCGVVEPAEAPVVDEPKTVVEPAEANDKKEKKDKK